MKSKFEEKWKLYKNENIDAFFSDVGKQQCKHGGYFQKAELNGNVYKQRTADADGYNLLQDLGNFRKIYD